ncbi:hypothetical protein G9F71_008775 [Clostridium sp. FP2]|uniref:hypothetical protein n=1 Tax=Clostridium sp. FP2 TaxID=2724481 RepID=UPI0013E9173C|nr:hypothetical protein [Clostridium sp. FP2]MBZ9622947.1 hypothetical protein [Clostridium sp. FP2]
MKGKLLSVKEVCSLGGVAKEYYIESTNSVVKDGIFEYGGGNYFHCYNNHGFSKSCASIRDGKIKVYEWTNKDERRNNIMKNAVVKFPNTSKQYHFMTDLDLETGDMVVCDTAVGVTVAIVTRLEEEVSSLATKWIIGKVDMAAHTKRMELEAKKKDIKAKMEKRRKKLEDIAVFSILAKEDPDMAELLKEYQEINN